MNKLKETTIRRATAEDADLILFFVNKLAAEEKIEPATEISKKQILKTFFCENPTAYAIICEAEGCPVGHAIYFFNYSTGSCKNGLYIEDIYVTPEYRHGGVGKTIFRYLSRVALEKDCDRIELSVFDWNKNAIEFYESLGAAPQDKLILYRLSESTLRQIAT